MSKIVKTIILKILFSDFSTRIIYTVSKCEITLQFITT
uniref:Uncharacterized protein n=1 Tax=virus sp. ctBM815 TaxID=2825806 RepID=A0A8S5RKU0_9VIRU|nr:MAG TPA: hypothetical protein [virus sp. ctBM815]